MNITKLIAILENFPSSAEVCLMVFDEHDQDYSSRSIGSFRLEASDEGEVIRVLMVEGDAQ
jgi:hypothetical protein